MEIHERWPFEVLQVCKTLLNFPKFRPFENAKIFSGDHLLKIKYYPDLHKVNTLFYPFQEKYFCTYVGLAK